MSKLLRYHQGMYLKQKTTVQDVTQAKTFQSKERHSTVSPEELSERWQIGLIYNDPSEAIQGIYSVIEQEAHMHVVQRYH